MGDVREAPAPKKQKALPKKGAEVRWKFPLGTFDAEHLYAAFEEEPAEGVVMGFYNPPPEPEADDKKSKSPPGPTSPVWLRVAFIICVEEDDGSTTENQVMTKVHPDWLC